MLCAAAIGGDMVRQCSPARLDARSAEPWLRDNCKHLDLAGWVCSQHGALLGALLTLARAWYAAGSRSTHVSSTGQLRALEQGARRYPQVSPCLHRARRLSRQSDVALSARVRDVGESYWALQEIPSSKTYRFLPQGERTCLVPASSRTVHLSLTTQASAALSTGVLTLRRTAGELAHVDGRVPVAVQHQSTPRVLAMKHAVCQAPIAVHPAARRL